MPRYANVYPGIDIEYYGNAQHLEFDFILAPGADPAIIHLEIDGANRIELGEHGQLEAALSSGSVIFRAPRLYQDKEGARHSIEGHYELRADGSVGFAVSSYDKKQTLVIDPVLEYSTFLGGSGNDYGQDVAVDSTGSLYAMGSTNSLDFPGVSIRDLTDDDVFVIKLNPAGTAIAYATYLGGSNPDEPDYKSIDRGRAITVDSAGNAYLTGLTNSVNFPTLASATQPTLGSDARGGYNAFVTKLDPTGSQLLISTYLGGFSLGSGKGGDIGYDIQVDSAGFIYVVGEASSFRTTFDGLPLDQFPTTPGAFMETAVFGTHPFVTKYNPDGSIFYSTIIDGTSSQGTSNLGTSAGPSIVVDDQGFAYIAGSTASFDFPVTPGAFQTVRGIRVDGSNVNATDAFVAKLNPTGTGLVYATYLGGGEPDSAFGLDIDGQGNAYIAGYTKSDDFPVANAIQSTRRGQGGIFRTWNGFVTKLNASGTGLVYSTYHSGSSDTIAFDISVDDSGRAYVAGWAGRGLPTTTGAIQPLFMGEFSDAFLSLFSADGQELEFSTYLGGAGDDIFHGVALDGAGSVYLAGYTESLDYPTTESPLQDTLFGDRDLIVVKIDMTDVPGEGEGEGEGEGPIVNKPPGFTCHADLSNGHSIPMLGDLMIVGFSLLLLLATHLLLTQKGD